VKKAAQVLAVAALLTPFTIVTAYAQGVWLAKFKGFSNDPAPIGEWITKNCNSENTSQIFGFVSMDVDTKGDHPYSVYVECRIATGSHSPWKTVEFTRDTAGVGTAKALEAFKAGHTAFFGDVNGQGAHTLVGVTNDPNQMSYPVPPKR